MRHHIQKRMITHLFLFLFLCPITFLSALSTTVRHSPAGISVRSTTDSPDTPVLIHHQPPPTPDGTLLVSTLDGTLHALDLRSGEYLWSFGAGASLLHSSFEKEARTAIEKRRAAEAEMDLMAEAEWNAEHQRETSHRASESLSQALSRHEQFERELARDLASHDLIFDQDEEEHSAHKRLEQQRKVDTPRSNIPNNGSTSPLMIPGVDGSLFYSGTHGLQRLPINVAELVEAAPFKTGDNTRYLGFKETNVFLIHRNSGALKRVFSPMHSHKFSLFEECEDAECDPNLIWVAKTDLTVHAIDGKSGKLRWNVSISTYAPFDNTETVLEMTEAELSSMGYPEIGVSVGGTVHAIDITEQHILWSQPLHSPVTSVFLVRPEQPTGSSTQDNVHVLNNAGDMIKLPHFYFDVPDEGNIPSADKVDPLNAMIAHYHRSRDLSEVTTFTYIGQTKNGLIYALPNPQPVQASGKLFVDPPVHPMSSLAMSAVPAVAKPVAGSPTIPSITVSPHSTAHSNTKAIAAGSEPIPVDEIDEELHCSPSSSTYPQCLIGFHAMSIGSGNTGSRGARNQQLLIESSVDFYNRSVKPISAPSVDPKSITAPHGGESKDDRTKSHAGALPAPVKHTYQEIDEYDDSLVSRTNPIHTTLHPRPKPKPHKESEYAPSFPGAHPSESFWAMWWQMLLMSVVISVLISLFMMWLQRQERKRKRALQAKKSQLKKKDSESELLAPGESSQDGAELSDDDGDGNFTMSRFSREFGNVGREFSSTASNFGRGIVGQTAAMRKRLKKELLRGVFQRQTSEPTPPPSSHSPHSPNNAATASGTLTTRKSHFSTYESDVPLFPNSGNNSGESKSLRPRKHIQSKPEINKMNEDAASSSLAPTLNKVFSTTTQHPDGSVSIGSMVLFPQKVLGTGSMGTVVYAGTFEGRPCAIKRLVKPFFGSANAAQEIALLIQSDQHPNVLRYYAKDEDTSFIYLALEQCVGTIQDLVDHPKTEYTEDQIKSILFGMMTGLAHLHSLHIVHRDIKPGNILLSSSKSALTAKLADMGLGKQLSLSRSSFDSVVSGSIGWQAPECLASGGRLTKAVDVFSAGIVMHYVLTKGVHPFGESVERELNIAHNRMDLSALAPYPEARDLIGCMLHYDPAMRMSAEDVVAHPYFWSPAKQLSFLLEASDRFESEPEHSELRMCLESQALEVVGENWHQHLHLGLVDNLHKYRKYDFSSVRDCLRVIRNKKNHYRDLPAELRAELGPIPEGFLNYFTSRFPAMLIYIYSVLSCFCLESPSSGFGDMYSYSPLDQDHFSYDADMRLEAVQAFFYKPLRDYPELRFSSPQFEQFYSLISLRRLVQLQKHTRLRFRHWHVHEDRWLKAGIPPANSNVASASNTASSSPLTEANISNVEPPPLLVGSTNENKED